LEAVVVEAGTERERLELVFSGAMRRGFTLAQWCGEEPLGDVVPDPDLLARLARRVERRARFGLPAVVCGGDPPTHGCTCLELALDEAGRGGKRAVLRLARGFHWSPPARRERVPSEEVTPAAQEASAEPQEATERVERQSPQPKPTPKPEAPFRIVKHFPRWYDDAERPRFSYMRF
jgi:hypothetical protein